MRAVEQTELAIAAKRLGIPDWKGRPELKSRILLLYQRHGVRSDKRCKSCRHLGCIAMGNRYYKCSKSPITGGPATDWRVNWPACGLWEERCPLCDGAEQVRKFEPQEDGRILVSVVACPRCKPDGSSRPILTYENKPLKNCPCTVLPVVAKAKED